MIYFPDFRQWHLSRHEYLMPLSGLHLILIVLICSPLDAIRIKVIFIANGDNPHYGYTAMAPVADVFFSQMVQLYPRLSSSIKRYTVYTPGEFSCPDGAAFMPIVSKNLSDILYDKATPGFSVIISPGCSLEVVALGDFAREWGVPLFSSLGSDPRLADKRRYPTVITFPSLDHRTISTAVMLFLQKYGWRTVTLLCDAMNQFGALTVYYQQSCDIVFNLLRFRPGQFEVYRTKFDSASSNSYEPLLRPLSQQSRIVIVWTHPTILRQILIAAKHLNMTDGSYVYLSIRTTTVPTSGNATWQYFDGHDQDTFDAFKSLIVIRNLDPKWDQIGAITDAIFNLTKSKYNKTLTPEFQLSDLAIGLYEAYQSFAAVLNETDDMEGMNGEKFCRRFWNRSFASVTRPINISPNGLRASDVQFTRMDPWTGSINETWLYKAITNDILTVSSDLAAIWVNSTKPPPDMPLCGFKDDLCPTATLGLAVPTLVGAVAGLTIVTAIAISLAFWKVRNTQELGGPWWSVDYLLLAVKNPARKGASRSNMCSQTSKSV